MYITVGCDGVQDRFGDEHHLRPCSGIQVGDHPRVRARGHHLHILPALRNLRCELIILSSGCRYSGIRRMRQLALGCKNN